MCGSLCLPTVSVTTALQGKDKVDEDQIAAATKLAIDRQNLFLEDKVAADGLCRPKKEKKVKVLRLKSLGHGYVWEHLFSIRHITNIYGAYI